MRDREARLCYSNNELPSLSDLKQQSLFFIYISILIVLFSVLSLSYDPKPRLRKQPFWNIFGHYGKVGKKEGTGGSQVSCLILNPEVAHVTSAHSSLARTGLLAPTQPQDKQEVVPEYNMFRRENNRNTWFKNALIIIILYF